MGSILDSCNLGNKFGDQKFPNRIQCCFTALFSNCVIPFLFSAILNNNKRFKDGSK